VARRTPHHDQQINPRRRVRRRVVSLLRDPRGWPSESAPLRVRAGVMSNLAAQRQHDIAAQRVTIYRDSRWSRRHRLQFSLRPPLAAAAVIAMIVSAAIHFMGGVEAWQPWANGIAGRFYEVPDGSYGSGPALVDSNLINGGNDLGRTEAEALFTDVLRFRAHMNGRIPVAERGTTPDSSPGTTPETPRESRPAVPSRRFNETSPTSP